MIVHRARLVLCCFAFAAICSAQSHKPESQTLEEVLAEIKAIHEDMRVTQSTQILLAELEMQQGVANRAMENADEARSRLLDVQRDQKLVASDVVRTKERLDKATTEDERKMLSDDLERHKGNVAALKLEEQTRAATLQTLEERLKTAQDSVETIEKELSVVIDRMRSGNK